MPADLIDDLFHGYTDAQIDAGTERLLAAIERIPLPPKAQPHPVTMDHYEADGFPPPQSDCEL